ncbi:MAG: UbiA family prenyltransferase [Bacteroidia bacterium]|nr:UbiA family prenyltransferase [Bacteroidia bacterium]
MKKYLIYLGERFPLQTHIPIIAIFSFSAICYSLSANQVTSFVPVSYYLAAFFLTFTLFLLLRISDEFKDHEEDMMYRKYLPVPRGLVTLEELRRIAYIILSLQVVVIFYYPGFLPIYVATLVYMAFMYNEFFVDEWLRKRQVAYVFSHMLIIPLVDLVASSAHWSMEGIAPPRALMWFFAVSFFNGILLEVGRKIKPLEHEEEGVVSYTKLWGTKRAVFIWLTILLVTLALAALAAKAIDSPNWVYILLVVFGLASALSTLAFLRKPSLKAAKYIENASGLWTMGMYLNLGALPFLFENIVN